MLIEDLQYHPRQGHWFGRVSHLYPGHTVELILEAGPNQEGLAPKLALVRELVADSEAILEQLHHLAYQKYQGTHWAKPLADIRTMYFLSGVTLKSDTTWWLVLEPASDVETLYNHLLRFTMINREIVWANFAHDITA